jgi:microcystin-dependent protein
MKNYYLLALVLTMSFGTSKSFAQAGFIGEIRMFAGNFVPQSWAFCDGQLLPISQNTALFSIVGTMYGGNGETTFALPDLRGRVAIHAGNGPGLTNKQQGSTGGTETTILSIANMPAHSHTVALNASTNVGTTNDPTGSFPANTSVLDKEYTSSSNATMGSTTTTTTGNNTSFSNMQPYGTVRYIICLNGVYPSQN